MSLAMIELSIFLMILGFGTLYLAFKRDGVMWSIIATVLFAVNIVYGSGLPFSTDASGSTVLTTANVVLSGISLLFAFLSLIKSVHLAFAFFKK